MLLEWHIRNMVEIFYQLKVNHFAGSGKFIITGQLGDVMKESASIALDYMKANSQKYGLENIAC